MIKVLRLKWKKIGRKKSFEFVQNFNTYQIFAQISFQKITRVSVVCTAKVDSGKLLEKD